MVWMDGDEDRVRHFLERNVPSSLQDPTGYTSLHYAARSGHLEICRLLLSNDADANAATPSGATPLHRAAYIGHAHVVHLLLAKGAKLSTQDLDGMNALHKAAASNSLPVVKVLLGNTHTASESHSDESTPPFSDAHLRLCCQLDRRGRSPFTIARQHWPSSGLLQSLLRTEQVWKIECWIAFCMGRYDAQCGISLLSPDTLALILRAFACRPPA